MSCCDFQALQEAQEKQQLLIKQKLDLENKLANSEKDLQKVTRWSFMTLNLFCFFTSVPVSIPTWYSQQGEFELLSCSLFIRDVHFKLFLWMNMYSLQYWLGKFDL